MSYLLDAMRKSERARPRRHAPAIQDVIGTPHASSHPLPSKYANRRPWQLVLLLLLTTVLMFVGISQFASDLLSSLRIDKSIETPQITPPASSTRNTADQEVAAYAERIKQVPETQPDIQIAAQHQPVTNPSSAPKSNDVEPVLARKIPPSSSQPRSLEVVSFSTLAENRFAMIDGAFVKEGDVLPDGFQITEIRRSQVVIEKGVMQETLSLN